MPIPKNHLSSIQDFPVPIQPILYPLELHHDAGDILGGIYGSHILPTVLGPALI